jgi:hypothetical protein
MAETSSPPKNISSSDEKISQETPRDVLIKPHEYDKLNSFSDIIVKLFHQLSVYFFVLTFLLSYFTPFLRELQTQDYVTKNSKLSPPSSSSSEVYELDIRPSFAIIQIFDP